MILKLGSGLNAYNVSINDDPGLTLTYFMARSNLVKITYYANTGPRCHVSIYRIIGPLVWLPTVVVIQPSHTDSTFNLT